ncbi:MAG: hypothetical protein MMC23_004989 [Stictis urceolatum]|nr:hypothetical protein [Stictis urceolata]
MPRSKPKPKPPPSKYNKPRNHQLADGWTQVLRGPPPRSPGLSTPKAVEPAEGLSVRVLKEIYDKTDAATKESDFRIEMGALLREKVVPLWRVGGGAEAGREGDGEVLGVEALGGEALDEEARKRAAVREDGEIGEEQQAEKTSNETGEIQANEKVVNRAEEIEAELGDRFKSIDLNNPPADPPTDPRLQQILLLGLGSPSHPSSEIRRVAQTQLCATEHFISLLTLSHALRPSARKIAQDPAFNRLDRAFLRSLGWEVVESPAAEESVGRGTVVFAPHVEMGVLRGVMEVWGAREGAGEEGVLVGNDLGRVEEGVGRVGKGDGEANREGERGEGEARRWWEGWERVKPVAAGNHTDTREWYDVCLHWRREVGRRVSEGV